MYESSKGWAKLSITWTERGEILEEKEHKTHL